MTQKPTEAQARVLTALRDGAELKSHARGERGPYYTLNGRRLSVTLLKALEGLRWIERQGRPGQPVAAYDLTPSGRAALAPSGDPAHQEPEDE
ncbi:hypothetical protein [Deinococcus sonorensis]|uniref:ArsR family transcriptional regulator n=2 Tax=Deinococcus sonorensis TaxID=309891 RepID=A0AAU7U4H9_9DEIO